MTLNYRSTCVKGIFPHEIAWAAGLFEGEGSFSTTHPDKGRGGKRRYLRVSLQMTDRDVLERFHAIVGVGAIYTVRADSRRPNARPMWQWTASGEGVFLDILAMFLPYLGERRRGRAIELLDQWGSGQLALGDPLGTVAR